MEGRAAKARSLAEEMIPVFETEGVYREAAAARVFVA
jgi:hypothetical protein